ncbi:hypothetical protein H5410_031945 [Solanum commersonii]|uniref:Uncharacterized protein n=1 Tax=Solanum commersonii TaxID=4109 RepID=A0A9J5YLG4_SOLCO|nr:hypothetical protein H5410_031945 [Solanum commersonii]
MEPIGLDGQNGLISRANGPRRRNTPILPIFRMSVKTLNIEPVSPDGQNRPFSRSNEPQSNSPSLLVFRNSDVIFADNLHGRPLRP